jgi:hypothetical protein
LAADSSSLREEELFQESMQLKADKATEEGKNLTGHEELLQQRERT